MLRAFVTVECYGETVYLILYLCEHFEEFALDI